MNPKHHKDNKGFSWSMRDGSFEYLSDDQINLFDSDGYLVVENAFDNSLISEIIRNIDPYEFNVTEALKGLDEGKFFISRAEEISTWFIKADFEAKVGSTYTFTASEEQGCINITGEIKEASPYTLIYTWIVQDTNVETTVKWVLEADGNKTKLYLEHYGISNFPEESAIKMFESFNGGWTACVTQLQDYLTEAVHA